MTRDNLSSPDHPPGESGPTDVAGEDWRDVQRHQTRKRITSAVHELIASDGHISVPRVAERAGVSPATVYRYFPDRASLLGAAAYEHVDTGLRPGQAQLSLEDYRQSIHTVYAAHDADLPAVIAAHATPAGRELRRKRGESRRGIIADNIRARGVDPTSPQGRRLAAVVEVISSSAAYLEFRDMTDLDSTEAADAVVWAIGAVFAATAEGREIEDLDPPSRDQQP